MPLLWLPPVRWVLVLYGGLVLQAGRIQGAWWATWRWTWLLSQPLRSVYDYCLFLPSTCLKLTDRMAVRKVARPFLSFLLNIYA